MKTIYIKWRYYFYLDAKAISMIRRFALYGLSGWCIEISFTGLYSLLMGDPKLSGKTYIWMFFIYGLAVFLEPIHNRIRRVNFVIRGGVYAVLILLTEYITGWFLSKLIGVCPWNYGSGKYIINGFTRIDFAPLWGAAGLLFEKLHDALKLPKILKEPEKE
jgi:uncharacterized membrane protein